MKSPPYAAIQPPGSSPHCGTVLWASSSVSNANSRLHSSRCLPCTFYQHIWLLQNLSSVNIGFFNHTHFPLSPPLPFPHLLQVLSWFPLCFLYAPHTHPISKFKDLRKCVFIVWVWINLFSMMASGFIRFLVNSVISFLIEYYSIAYTRYFMLLFVDGHGTHFMTLFL